MKLRKAEKERVTDDTIIILEMNADEYGEMCQFLTKNAVGYGPSRNLVNKFLKARDTMRAEEKNK